MKRTLKKIFIQSIDILPAAIGFELYHAFQKRFTGSFQKKFLANKKTFETAQHILSESGGLKGKNVLEIGSGWMPIMPYLLKIEGECNTVFTFDINNHYHNKYIDELNAQFKNDGNLKVSQSGLHLPDFVKYYPNSNVIGADLPQNVDLIFSRFVLEHVPPEDIEAMHIRFSQEYDEQTLIMHFISPSDHRAYSDKSISHYDFLKYSQDEWDNIQTKFDYHNRLRLPQYLNIFEKTGFDVVHLEYDKVDPASRKYELFKQLKLHPDFESFLEEEILAGSIIVLLRKKTD